MGRRGPAPSLWRKPVLRWLRLGWITAIDAQRMAGISRMTLWHWCKVAGVKPRQARNRYLATLYANEMARMAKRDFSKRRRGRDTEDKRYIAPFMAPLIKRKVRKPVDKAKVRADNVLAIEEYLARGGKIKKLAPKPL